MTRTRSITALAAAAVTGVLLAATAAGAAAAAPAHSATATSGTRLWESRYTGTAGAGAVSLASVISPDGSTVLATGGSRKGGSESYVGQTLAYRTSTGAKLWRTADNPARHASTEFDAIAASPDGSAVYVTGTTSPTGHSSGGTVITVAYDAATGAALWTAASTAGGDGDAVAVSPDGSTVYVSGGDTTWAYSAATGTALWTDTFGGGVVKAALSGEGTTLFADVNAVSGESVVALSTATGATLWTQTGALAGLDVQGLTVSPDSATVYVTGAWGGSPGTATAHARTIALAAAAGTTLWTKTFTSPNGGSYANALAVSPDGTSVFVTGSTTSTAKKPVAATWALNAATGASVWQRNLAYPGALSEITVSPDGSRVFTGGEAAAGSSGQGAFSTAAYDPATGAVLWSLGADSSDGPWYSFAASLGVTPDSATVIVSGDVNTPPPGTKPTAATVAYSA